MSEWTGADSWALDVAAIQARQRGLPDLTPDPDVAEWLQADSGQCIPRAKLSTRPDVRSLAEHFLAEGWELTELARRLGVSVRAVTEWRDAMPNVDAGEPFTLFEVGERQTA